MATYGVDTEGKLYVHVKVYKQHRIYGNVKITLGTGTVELQCRECIRWYRVVVRDSAANDLSLDEIDSISATQDTEPAEDHGGPPPARLAKVGNRDD